jgi:hypothetical protein
MAQAEAEEEYLKTRLEDQIAWYDRKSKSNQTTYKWLRIVEILSASAIPFLAGYSDRHPSIPIMMGVLGLVVAVLAGVMGLFRFQENWSEYRTASEALKQEKFLYLAGVAPYNEEDRFDRLVARVESILNAETSNWTKSMQEAVKADRERREKKVANPEV